MQNETMIDAIIEKKPESFATAFNDRMNQKVADMLEAEKQAYLSAMFGAPETKEPAVEPTPEGEQVATS